MTGLPFTTTRRVEFRDTDAAGIVHFSVFFTMMEAAEHALLRSVGLSVHSHDEQGTLSWPCVAAKCDYRSPVRFEDELELEVVVLRLGIKSATYRTTFRCRGQTAAVGEVTAVCCRMEPAGVRPVPIPHAIAEALRPHCLPSSS